VSPFSWRPATTKSWNGKVLKGAYHENEGKYVLKYGKSTPKPSCRTMAERDRRENGNKVFHRFPPGSNAVWAYGENERLGSTEDWRLAEPRSLPDHKCLQTTLWNSLAPNKNRNAKYWMGGRLRDDLSKDGSYEWTWESDGARVADGWTNWAPNEPPSDAVAQGKLWMCLDIGWIKAKDGPESQWYACKQDGKDENAANIAGYRYSACCDFDWPGKTREKMFQYSKVLKVCTTTTTTTILR